MAVALLDRVFSHATKDATLSSIAVLWLLMLALLLYHCRPLAFRLLLATLWMACDFLRGNGPGVVPAVPRESQRPHFSWPSQLSRVRKSTNIDPVESKNLSSEIVQILCGDAQGFSAY